MPKYRVEQYRTTTHRESIVIEAENDSAALVTALAPDDVSEVASVTLIPTYVFTVFCQEYEGFHGIGTIWIGHVEIEEDSWKMALIAGKKECAAAWDMQSSEDHIHVLGVVRGRIETLYWNDIDA